MLQFTKRTLKDESLAIFRLTHAGYFVTSKKTSILIDPLFINDWAEFLILNPTVEFNFAEIKKLKLDGVIISHFHNDHFCLKSLNYVSRETLIVFPAGCKTIPFWLKTMGFKNLQELKPLENIKVGDIEIEATVSHAVGVNEMGMFIQKGKSKILNLVDTEVYKKDVESVVKRKGMPSVSFCFYQPLRESDVYNGKLLSISPKKIYQRLQDIVGAINESIIVPSACSWAYKYEPELNYWMFPISEEKFCEDIKQRFPLSSPTILEPGQGFVFDNGKLRNVQKLSWVQKLEKSKTRKGPIVMKDHGNRKIENRKSVTLKMITELLSKIKKSESEMKWNYEFLRPRAKSFYVQLSLSPAGNSFKVLERKPRKIMSKFTTTAFITATTEGMLNYSLAHTGQYLCLADPSEGQDPLLEACFKNLQKKYLFNLVFSLET